MQAHGAGTARRAGAEPRAGEPPNEPENATMADYMEDKLDMPLGQVLPIIQQGIMDQSTYFGIRTQKSPADAWIYQEIVFATKPDVIVEIGNKNGGSTLMLAHQCDLMGKGRVIGVDISHRTVPETVKKHPRITLIEADACQALPAVERLIADGERVLVIEDSEHTYANTLNVLRLYSKFVQLGDYFIVEDSICHHGLAHGPQPGPYEAIETFVKENADFQIDRSCERFLITWNPKGYLRRVARGAQRLSADQVSLHAAPKVMKTATKEALRQFLPPILVEFARRLMHRG